MVRGVGCGRGESEREGARHVARVALFTRFLRCARHEAGGRYSHAKGPAKPIRKPSENDSRSIQLLAMENLKKQAVAPSTGLKRWHLALASQTAVTAVMPA